MTWIRNIFKKKVSNNAQENHDKIHQQNHDELLSNNEIYLHEDLYLQVEIVPRENSGDLDSENDAIKEFSQEHSNGVGFTDIYERDEQKTTTASRNIVVNDFEKILLDTGLIKLDSVYTGYGNYREKCEATNAYQIDDATVFCDYENEMIQNIWVDGFRFKSNSEHIDIMINALYTIGKTWNLILNDWDLSETLDLESKEEIRKYISEN